MNSQTENASVSKRSLGKTITTIGVSMIALSIVLGFVGVSGALFHNVMQLGGLVAAIAGLVVWKVLKK